MIFLWIALSIILLVVLILLLPIHLVFDYRQQRKHCVYFRVLFLKFDAYKFIKRFFINDKNKKTQGTDESSEKTSKKARPVDLFGFVEFLFHLTDVICSTFDDFFSKAKVNLKELYILFGSEDAAKTALLSAMVTQASNGLCSVLESFSNFRCNPRRLSIQPDFTSSESKFSLHLDISGSVFHILGVYFRANVRFFELD